VTALRDNNNDRIEVITRRAEGASLMNPSKWNSKASGNQKLLDKSVRSVHTGFGMGTDGTTCSSLWT